jgi:hypothetical protein
MPVKPKFQTLFTLVERHCVHEMTYQAHAPAARLPRFGHLHAVGVKTTAPVVDADEASVARIMKLQAHTKVLSALVPVMNGVDQRLLQTQSEPARLRGGKETVLHKRRGGFVKETADGVKPTGYLAEEKGVVHRF